MNCGDSCAGGNGWLQSGSGGICGEKDCGVGLHKSYLESLQPGLLVTLERDSLLVTGVIPDSPADRAGVIVGDKILKLNGEDVASSCSGHGWPSPKDPRRSDLLIARGGQRLKLAVALESASQLAARTWGTASSRLVRVSNGVAAKHDIGNWVYGANVTPTTSTLRVTDVMAGSPAYENGLTPGDEIISIDGLSVANDPRAASKLSPAANPSSLVLVYSRSGVQKTLRLKSIGISEILRSFAARGKALYGYHQVLASSY